MRKSLLPMVVGVLIGAQAPIANAQHENHGVGDDNQAAPDVRHMFSAVMPGVLMSRDGSGTSWHPDNAPMSGIRKRAGGWGIMVHGAGFLRYNAQDVFDSGARGDAGVDAPHQLMISARRPIGSRHQVTIRGMGSLEPLTQGGDGYPLLFQTGETHQGSPIVDRQHPHDAIAELAVIYGVNLGQSAAGFVYFGLPGEPALGPSAFMHRPSARHNPNAPLSHHWQDATHISHGVATIGARAGRFKIEGSLFTGREPDESRYGFDEPTFDSFSYRVSANASPEWSLQFSRGHLTSPELLDPDHDVNRTTASALFDRRVQRGAGHLSMSFVWGMNQHVEEERAVGAAEHGFVVEVDYATRRMSYYGRAERVQKTARELGLFSSEKHGIGAATIGLSRNIRLSKGLHTALGVQATTFAVPKALQGEYGSAPVSAQAYLRLSTGN